MENIKHYEDSLNSNIENTYHISPLYYLAKRGMDILVSIMGIILCSPMFLLIAIAIKYCDGGTVFYHQQRLTKGGKIFRIHKFRSMKMNAEQDGIARLAVEGDERITPVGKFLRDTHLDELPQLFNVLAGEMTLVGPRPERPEIEKKYTKELPAFSLRLQTKAGITGYAQVYGNYDSPPLEKLQMDLFYLEHASILMDIRLIFATAYSIFINNEIDGKRQRRKRLSETENISCKVLGEKMI